MEVAFMEEASMEVVFMEEASMEVVSMVAVLMGEVQPIFHWVKRLDNRRVQLVHGLTLDHRHVPNHAKVQ